MGYRNGQSYACEIILIDGHGKELGSIQLASEGPINIEDHEPLTDVTTDDEPEGVVVLMVHPPE